MCSNNKIIASKAIRVIFFVMICFIVLITISFNTSTPIFKDYANSYELYLNENSSNAKIISANATMYPFIHNKHGESCTVSMVNNKFDLSKFLIEMGADLVFTETLEEGTCYYAYSPKIKYRKSVGDRIINLHVYIGKNTVKVGSPLIYGGY